MSLCDLTAAATAVRVYRFYCPTSRNMSYCCFSQMDDEPFNPDYVEVDRVLDVSESTDENGEVCVYTYHSLFILL